MAQPEIARAIVDLNGDQAGQVLKTLKKQARELRAAIKDAAKANDLNKVKKLREELGKNSKVQKQFKNATHEVNVEMGKLNGMSMNNLRKAQKGLLSQLNKMKRSTKEEIALYKQKLIQYKQISAEMNRHRSSMMANQGTLTKLSNGFNKYFSMATAAAASILALILGFRSTVDAANDFEARLDNLSAITGLAGKELENLGDIAIATSQKQLESGVRITQAAGDIVDAYMLMGSLRPELLKDSDALTAVTLDAIVLSEAAKMELEPAIEALAITMNQFGSHASESSRIINVLGAGSKVGAGNIPYLSKAMERVGTTANLMNIPIETTVGLIESFAPFFKDAGKGGRSLDRVLMTLRATGVGYKDGLFDVNLALTELEEKYKSGITSVDIFGKNHAKMGDLLVLNKDKYLEYTAAVTGSNVAVEQAGINTDNNSAKLAQAKNRLNAISIELGEKLAPSLTFSTKAFSYFLKALMKSMAFYKKHRTSILALVAVWTAYTIAVNLSMIQLRLYIIATNLAARATNLFKAAMASNPIMLLVTLLATAGVALYSYLSSINDAEQGQLKFNSALEETNRLMMDGKSIEERSKLIKSMSKNQLKDFISDSEEFLNTIDDWDLKKMLTAKRFNDAKQALQVMEASLAQDFEIRNQKILIHGLETHYNDLLSMKVDSNNDQIEEDLAYAKKRLEILSDPTPVVKKKDSTAFDPGSLASPDTSFTDFLKFKNDLLEQYRADDIKGLQAQFEKDALVRKEHYHQTLALLGNNEEQRAIVTKNYEENEMNRKVAFMNKLTSLLNSMISENSSHLSLEDSVLSDEEKAALELKIQQLKTALAELQDHIAVIRGDSEDAEKTDIFGMTPEDWEGMMEKFDKVLEYYGYFEEAVMGINQIISNTEQQQVEDMEASNSKKKQLLNKQLNQGELSYEQYTARISALDEQLDQKRRKVAHDQAVREKAIGLMGAIINTALAVGKALASSVPPASYVMAGISAALGGIQIGVIASEPVPQYFKGNYYDVIGEDDRQKYRASLSYGTGVYEKPTLVSGLGLVADHGSEMVFSNEDTTKIMNAPGLVDAITDTISGYGHNFTSASTASPNTDNSALIQMLSQVSQKLDQPFVGYINPDHDYITNHQDAVSKYDKIQKEVNA